MSWHGCSESLQTTLAPTAAAGSPVVACDSKFFAINAIILAMVRKVC